MTISALFLITSIGVVVGFIVASALSHRKEHPEELGDEWENYL